MFSSALKSISSTNITANYTISPSPTSAAGPWKIYDAKKKSTGKAYSVFVFDRKSLEPHGGSISRSSAASLKRAAEEVVERLKKEASSLAKLRHPSILELVEPVEDTRGGGLQFVTEAVTASLSSLLQEKDEQERAGGSGRSRYVTEDSDGVRRRRELEIDELEIQKGLLQVSKALEFLHDNAGLVHGNLTPDAILVNAKVRPVHENYPGSRSRRQLRRPCLFCANCLPGCSPTGRSAVYLSAVLPKTPTSQPRYSRSVSPKSSTSTPGCLGLCSSTSTTPHQISFSTITSRPQPTCSPWGCWQ